MKLAEAFNFRHWQVVPAHMQPGVKKHAAMPGRQHKVIAANPTWLVRIMFECVTIEHRAYFRTTEREPEMPGLRGLHCVHTQTARLGRGTRERFSVQTHDKRFMVSVLEWKANSLPPQRKIDSFLAVVAVLGAGKSAN